MKEKLLKFLNLSLSQNENEAFVSVKKANELIKRENTTWSYVFRDKEPEIKYEESYILKMQLLKQQSYSQRLEEDCKNLNILIKYLVIIIIILIGYIIIF